MLILGGRTEYYEITRLPGELGISGGGGGDGRGSVSVHSFSDAGNNSSFFSVDDFLCADFTVDLTAEEQDGTLCISQSRRVTFKFTNTELFVVVVVFAI
jgi:hypothetical protein